MPTPRQGYRLKDGTKVPSVTQITGRYGDKEAIIGWYRKLALKGIDPDEEKRKAGEIGTHVHARIEKYLNPAAEPEYPDLDIEQGEMSAKAYDAFMNWVKTHPLDVIELELRLVSEQHKFGGTLDCVALVGNELCLFDWKTSSGLYPEHKQQIAAYTRLWNENFPDRPMTMAHLIRIGKDGVIEPHEFTLKELHAPWTLFNLYRECWAIEKGI